MRFLDENRDLVDDVDDTQYGEGYTPLHYAAYAGHAHLCTLLLERHAQIDAVNDAGCTALFLSAQQGQAEVVDLLLEKGAKTSLADNEFGFTAVDVAATGAIRRKFKFIAGHARPSEIKSTNVMLSGPGALAVSWDAPEVVENKKDGRSEPPLPLIGYVVRVCTGVDADGDGKKDVVKEVNLALEELEGKESEDGRTHWVDVQKLPTDGTAYACQV